MSAVPASAEQARLVLERVVQLRRREPAVLEQPEHSPGSTLPERVAMTRPSSGVKPIVVSTQRPSRTARERRAGAEVAGDDARAAAVRAARAARRDA